MKKIIIYDLTGAILCVYDGECKPPQGVPYMYTDEPGPFARVDVADPENPVVVPVARSEPSYEQLREQVVKLGTDLTATQLALTEMFELMSGGDV